MLELQDVWVSLSNIDIIRGVTLSFPVGIHGLIGPNGAGKSTLINAIAGAVPLKHGEIQIAGARLSGMRADQVARRGVTRTFQIPRPIRGVSCKRFVGLAGVSPQVVESCLAQVGMTDKHRIETTGLTLPELRRLEFARALAMRPKVLIMDEVMAGLSEVEQHVMLDIVRRVADEGVLVIMVEHIMTAVRAICATTTVLLDGTVLLQGDTASVLADQRTIDAYLGVAGTPVSRNEGDAP